MKKLILSIFLVILTSIPAFALTAPYVGVAAGVYGISYIPISGGIKGGTDAGLMNRFELMFGNKIFFYGHYTVLMPDNIIFDAELRGFSPMSFGGGLGAGYRLFDDRINNRGASMVIGLDPSFNYGLAYDNSSGESYYSSSYDVLSIGAEVFATYFYNVYKHFALRVGANFGIFGTKYMGSAYSKETDKYETITYSKGVSIVYGLSVGFAF